MTGLGYKEGLLGVYAVRPQRGDQHLFVFEKRRLLRDRGSRLQCFGVEVRVLKAQRGGNQQPGPLRIGASNRQEDCRADS